jgi:hypothetical protein
MLLRYLQRIWWIRMDKRQQEAESNQVVKASTQQQQICRWTGRLILHLIVHQRFSTFRRRKTCDIFYRWPPLFRVGLLDVSNVLIVVGVTSFFTLSIHHFPIALKGDIISSGPSTLSLYNQSFNLWRNPRLVTRVGLHSVEWEALLNDLVDGVSKEDKLLVAGLQVVQWRPVNLAQLFSHYSPVRKSCVSHETGGSWVGVRVGHEWIQNYWIVIGGTERSKRWGSRNTLRCW